MACTYTLIDANGKQITLNGPAEFKAYLVESGLKQFYPDGKYPWSPKEAAEIERVKQQPKESSNDTRQNQAESQRDSGIRANNQSGFGPTNQESVENATPENVGKVAKGRNNKRPGADSAGSNVGIGGTVRESGTATNRRAGTSGKRVANDGVGEERRNASSVESQRGNYHIDDPDTLIGGTPKVRFARNKKAIEAYQSITSEGRAPTQDELDAMAAYIGWGSFGQELFQGSYDNPRPKDGWKDESEWLREHLGKTDWESAQASIINAHYTDPITVGAMWDMVSQLGFKGGRTLEPSMGIGNFYGLMPKALAELSTLTGIEMDSLTGGMAKILYPDANIQIKPYQDSKTADGFYDLVIGNWPFAKNGPADRRYMRLSPSLHDYFFLKALDQTRAGGLVVGITSAGTMDKKGTLTRAALAEKADLVAAFRLPSGAFEKYAGTSVVTDIIILKKRDTPNADVKASGWLNTAEVNTPSGNKVTVNEYFANNPDKVLGTLNFGHGTTYGRPAMVVNRPDDLEARLKGLAKTLPAGVFEPVTTKAKTTQYITNNTTDRQQSITEQGGKLYQVQGEYLAPLDEILTYKVKDANKTADRLQQIKDLVGMRRAYGELIDAEREGYENTETKRKTLRDAYNAFTKANGLLRDSYGLSALKKLNDPFYPSLAALEMPDGSPSAILSKATLRAKRRLENPSVRDALVLARNESINLDMNRVADLSGVSVDEAAKQLMDAGAIFRTPDGNYEVSDVYLSGNVRRKLREAQDAEEHGVDMKRNIEALKDVLPPDVPYFNIEAKLGATWIRPKQYGEFIAHLLGVKPSNDIEVRWAVNRWKVSLHDKALNHKPEATTTWGHSKVKFAKLIESAMGNVAVKVQYRDEDGNVQTDEAATAEANNKAQQIREEFANWLWSDPVRKIEMERTYNEVMNAIALPSYDGSFLSFEGMALQRGDSPFNLRQHQADAIWRGLANGRGLYAHEVGTGKTYTMGGIAVESRRYGIAKKPIIFAHNANSASVAREIGEMYPGAKLLYIDNLAPDRIAVTLRQIQSDDWDAVVVPHSLIDRFTLKRDTLMDLAREQIEALEQEAIETAQEEGASLDVKDMDDPDAMKKVRSATAKQLVHARNAIIKKIDDMALRSSREDAISFEDMGIDMVIVDEAHEFKKPPLATRMRMKGLNTQSSAQSISMMFLTDYVKKLNNGRGVHLFTGTPITNTMTEIYNQMRYVMDDQMSRDGIRDWDAWFNTFADSTSDVELTATGEYEPITRLASFVNVAELRRIIGQYMDIVFADDMPEFKPRETKSGKTLSSDNLTDKERNELLNGRTENPVGRPYKKVVSDIAEMTEQQKGILALLQQRANAFKNASKKERREMMLSGSPNSPVIVETDSANAGLDARLFDINASDSPTSKVNRAVKRIMEHYDEHDLATQVVFVERGFTNESVSRKKDQATGKITIIKKARFNLVKDLVDKLVEQGIPANQIAIVDGSTTKEKRKAIADAMNRAEIRIVIGNTKTLGVGVNMQTNLRAMHHLDAPWMPGDLEQRNGRGHRQGNKWNTVMEYRYLTERIDGRRWQVLAVKDRFIKAFLKAKDDVRVIDGDAVSMDEEGDIGSTLAEAAGDPRLLMMNKLRGDVQKLEAKERMHSQGVFDAAQKIKSLGREIEQNTAILGNLRNDDDAFRSLVKDGLSFEINGKQYNDAEKANEAIARQVQRMEVSSNATLLGKAWGFDVYGYWPGRAFNVQYFIDSGKNRYGMGKPTVESVRATLYAIKGQADKLETKIANAKDSLPRMEEATKAPFARAADLEKKRKMLSDVDADIQANPIPAPAWLRNGAPVGSEAMVGGKPVVIEGHRWTNDGYLVTVTEGDKTHDVDYLEVKDENGLPIYDVQPFAKPEIAEPIEDNESQKYSKAKQTTGSTVAQIEKLLPNRVKKMAQAGKLKVVQSVNDLPASLQDAGNALYHTVWHGSPYDFEQFSSEKINTGEGAQAFGYGLYFTDKQSVAEWYRDTLSKDTLSIKSGFFKKNKIFNEDNFKSSTGKTLFINQLNSAKKVDISALINDIKTSLDLINPKNDYRVHTDESLKKKLQDIKDITSDINMLEKIKNNGGFSQTTNKKLYEVELAPTQDEYLDWDKPLSEQSEKVRDALNGMRIKSPWSDSTNKITGWHIEEDLLSRAVHVFDKSGKRIRTFQEPTIPAKQFSTLVNNAKEFADKAAGFTFSSYMKGSEIYKALTSYVAGNKQSVLDALRGSSNGEKAASDYLHSLGIRGIRYKAEGGKSDANNYVIFSDEDISIAAKYSKLAGVEGLYDPKSDTVYLVADMLNKDNLQVVLSHELLHRAEMTDKRYIAAIQKFESQLKERFELAKQGIGSAIEIKAAKRVIAAGTKLAHQEEEFRAYIVSEYTKSPNSFVGELKKIIVDFIAAIRMALLRSGFDMGFINTLTPADLYALSKYGANANLSPISQTLSNLKSTKAIPATIKIDGIDRPTTNSNGQPIHATEEGIRNFWRWFGDSKVVDAEGRPLVIYHGSPDIRGILNEGFKPFSRGNVWFAAKDYDVANSYADPMRAFDYQNAEENVIDLYVSLKNPLIIDAEGKHWKETEKYVQQAEDNNKDGIIIKNTVDYYNNQIKSKPTTVYAWFNPAQSKSAISGQLKSRFDNSLIKNATGNTGAFDPNNPDIRYSKQFTDLQNKAIDAIQDRIKTSRTFNKWHLTIGTQHHKALIDKDYFGKVFNASLNLENDTARFANESADEAPSLLPKTESLQEVAKEVAGKGFKRIKDAKKIADAIFETTLNDSPMSDAELKAKGYSDEQRKMYKEFFAAVNHSLDELAKSELFRLARSMKLNLAPKSFSLHETADFYTNQLTKDEDKELFNQKVEQIDKLQTEGYAPLMRFGRFTVDVVDKASGKREFFGMFETETEANEMAKVLAETYPDATISHGETSQKSWEMFKGVTPETMETIAKMMNAEQDEAFQLYLVQAINNRDAMKRLIHRKKIPGFAKDPQRILAAFITSNAKATSKNYNMGELVDAISHIPKDKGDVIDEAVDLYNFVQNPSEVGSQIRGLLFAWYLGGSFASAMVNTTQTLTTTLPYLHQFGSTQKVAGILGEAMKLAAKNPKTIGGNLGRALHRAEEEGITAPHELHMLYGESMRTSLASNAMIRPLQKAWGSLFSLTEGYNRRTAFIAAYNLAKENKHQNPFEFAADAVNQTQFIYSKSSRPNWARGAVGSTLFTFKTFTINYLEFLKRLPMQERLIALGVLILMSGLSGLPGSDDADDILDTIGQYLGYNTNTKEWKEKIINDMLGKEAGQFALHGVSSFLPIDIGSRLSVGNVIPGTAILKKSEIDKKRDVMEFFGAAGSLAEKGIQAFEASQGREGVIGKAQAIAHAALPKALSDAYQALDMVQTGYYRDYKGKNVQKVSEADALFKMLGLQPTKVSEPKYRERMIQQDIAMTKAVETDIADLWADGIYAKNQNKVKEAKEMLAEWNRKNPETPIKVKMSQIMKRVKAMKQTSGERLMKTAPKELRKFASESLEE